jgi:hypothetical protein
MANILAQFYLEVDSGASTSRLADKTPGLRIEQIHSRSPGGTTQVKHEYVPGDRRAEFGSAASKCHEELIIRQKCPDSQNCKYFVTVWLISSNPFASGKSSLEQKPQ